MYTRRSNCHQIANLVMGFVYFSSWVELRAVSIVKDVDDLASGATSRTTGQSTTKCSFKRKKKKKREANNLTCLKRINWLIVYTITSTGTKTFRLIRQNGILRTFCNTEVILINVVIRRNLIYLYFFFFINKKIRRNTLNRLRISWRTLELF